MSRSIRREALLVELVPILGGLLGLAVWPLERLIQNPSGGPLPPEQMMFSAPYALGLFIACWTFPWTGAGWMIAGRIPIGVAIMIPRLVIISWVYAWFLGSEYDPDPDPMEGRIAFLSFLAGMAISVASMIVLTYRTRSQARQFTPVKFTPGA